MKTKIFVLHLKEILLTAVFACLGIILIVMICLLLLPDSTNQETASKTIETTTDQSAPVYTEGDYDVPLKLGDQSFTLRVSVSSSKIEKIDFVDLSSECETMYPLLKPSLEDLSSQILQTQSLNDIVYSDERKYTSLVLINAIREALEKAAVSHSS